MCVHVHVCVRAWVRVCMRVYVYQFVSLLSAKKMHMHIDLPVNNVCPEKQDSITTLDLLFVL